MSARVAVADAWLRARVEGVVAKAPYANVVVVDRLEDADGVEGVAVLVVPPTGRRSALELLARRRVRHMVPADDRLEERLGAVLAMLGGGGFGIGRHVAGVCERRVIESAVAKQAALDELGAMAVEALQHPMLADLLVASVDEMVINALYRAAPPAPPVIEWAYDDRLLGVSVRDTAGALDESAVFGGLARALEQEHTGMAPGASSAALGFRVMLSGLSALAIQVAPGRATEVVGVVSRNHSLGEHRRRAPAFSLVVR